MKFSRVCLTATFLLFFIVIGILANANYLDNTASHIINSIDGLPNDPFSAAEEAKNIKTFWEERKIILSFTLSDTSLDGISLLLDEMLIAIDNSDNEEYQKATARLRRAVESINQLEKISLSNIF